MDHRWIGGSARALVFAAGALACASCTPIDKPGADGQLANDAFLYQCSLPSDAACDTQPADVPFEAIPEIALGARFQLRVDAADDVAVSLTSLVETESSGPSGTDFLAKKEGYAVIVSEDAAATGDKTDVEDLTHVHVKKAAGLELFTGDDAGQFEPVSAPAKLALTPLVDRIVRVAPVDAEGQILAGALVCSWKSSAPDVVAVEGSSNDNVVRLSALKTGTATITVSLGELEATFDVDVEAATP
jgi:hypothetical protein